MGVPGRKSWTGELMLAQRYSDLTPKAFAILKKSLESKDKLDQRWAVEQLNKAFIKMLPQDHTSGGQPIQIVFDASFKSDATTRQTKRSS